ncbi:hypothetical protein GGX14DRAFT_609173 [Mycena pura]|uniref:Uncharacterized protein n=1 Tax=Mycena pura TaxID=153505 RepID=A0AAD6UKX2_9AGAR|nr:hypothetical protein GGX14DRAFT_609173 [Mycena pura]
MMPSSPVSLYKSTSQLLCCRHAMTPQTYSEFFFSGLRVMADMPHIQTVLGPEQAAPNALKASARYNVLRGLARRRRRRTRTSPSPAPFMTYEAEKAPPPTSSRKQRRASIIDLPARLLGRMLQSMPDAWSLPGAASDRTRHAETEVYLSRASTSYKIADPFGTSPCSSSFFTVDYAEEVLPPVANANAAPPPRRIPNQRRRSVFEPIQHLRLPIPRMRRHSTQSLPAPATVPVTVSVARPARSLQIQTDRVRLRPRVLDEEDVLSSTWSADSDLEHDGAPDPVGLMDWRQFHADLLREEL